MTLFLDVNMLLYVVFNSYSGHDVCRTWFEGAMDNSANLIGFPTVALLGFVRISTLRVFDPLQPPLPPI
jgi:predicted nucleic acid-binding protein